jgi:dTDP-4-amino-4,6-dideoxygalactose transaminase
VTAVDKERALSAADKLNVPFIDIRAQNRSIWPELQEALDGVVSQAQFVLGPAVERFEAAFARYIGTEFCVGLNSGTSALHMALQACDVGRGDEVITTPHTWISTSWAVSYVGATPVFVDIDPVTYNIDPAKIEKAVTPHTKVLLPVHLYGQACDLEALCRICREHDLLLIEDAAQAHGAAFNGRRVGSFGRVGCFSFYPGKNLGAFGEGGAVVTDDERLAQRIRRLRDHAQDGRHHHVELGHNTRMEGIQGAVLEVKLKHLDEWNHARRQHADRYRELLADVPGVELPASPRPESHVWHLFVILVQGADRDHLRAQLGERGIASGVHYPTPVPFQPAYAHLGYQPGDFPTAQGVMDRCLSLPMFPAMTEEQLKHVAEAVRSAVSAKSGN